MYINIWTVAVFEVRLDFIAFLRVCMFAAVCTLHNITPTSTVQRFLINKPRFSITLLWAVASSNSNALIGKQSSTNEWGFPSSLCFFIKALGRWQQSINVRLEKKKKKETKMHMFFFSYTFDDLFTLNMGLSPCFQFIHSHIAKKINIYNLDQLDFCNGPLACMNGSPKVSYWKLLGGDPKLMKGKLNLRCTMWYRECVNIRHYKADKQTYKYIQSIIQSSQYIHHVNRVYYK